MSFVHAFVDQVKHPRCNPAPFKLSELVLRVGLLMSVLALGVILWPSAWWLLIAFVLGLALITHPLCLVTHAKHGPGGHWFHLEKK